jgi:hypothetical protein
MTIKEGSNMSKEDEEFINYAEIENSKDEKRAEEIYNRFKKAL